MTPQRWDRVKQIFDLAIASAPPDDRESLLSRECQGDAALRAEVERLLAHDAWAGDFLESPAARLPSLMAQIPPDLPVFAEGETVSARYRIVRRIGAGGMGEVYQAEDLALGCQAAIKTIRPEIAGDLRTLARFKREIQLGRSVTHRNVCRVFDIAVHQSPAGVQTTYLTMEMVEGETLAALLERKGVLSLAEALPLIHQMVAALDAAHRAGIVHRDFKPSNVIVAGPQNDPRVVVTDFGLASTVEVPETSERISISQALMGTPAYMAPEQLDGDLTTPATDIYAFGLILYEMLTGKPAFPGASRYSGALARLTKDPIPPHTVRSDLDPRWEKLILRCLERDPAERFQNGTELLGVIEGGATDSGTVYLPPLNPLFVRRRFRPRWPALSVAAAVILAAALGVIVYRRRAASPPPFSLENAQFVQLTSAPGQELFPTFSPDGKELVYAGQSAGVWDLYRLKIGEKQTVNLTAGSGADNTEPAISPNGPLIAFRSEREGGGIFLMPFSGGPATRLSSLGHLPAWSPDGTRIACSTSTFFLVGRGDVHGRLLIIDVKTGSQQYPNLEDNAVQPSWSPHGHRIAYWRLRGGRRDICTIPVEGGPSLCITDDAHLNWNPVWSPGGRYLYFASDRSGSMNLWRVPIDENSGKLTGDFVPVTTPSAYSGYMALSQDGSRLAYAQVEFSSQLQRVAFDPQRQAVAGKPEPLTQGLRVACCPNPSPDGNWVAFGIGGGREGVSVIRSNGTEERALIMSEHRNRMPRWSPNGDWVAFSSNRGGTDEIWAIHPDGSGLRQLTAGGGLAVRYGDWSPDGKLLFYDVQGDTPRIIEVDKPASRQNPAVLPRPDGPQSEFRAENWSPDGSQIVGTEFRADGTRGGLLIYSIKTSSYRRLTESGSFAVWLNDGRNLLFNDGGRVFLVNSGTYQKREVLSIPGGNVDEDFGISRDRRTVYFRMSHTEADIWLLASPSDPVISRSAGH